MPAKAASPLWHEIKRAVVVLSAFAVVASLLYVGAAGLGWW